MKLIGVPEEKGFLGFENSEMGMDRRLVVVVGVVVLWRVFLRSVEKREDAIEMEREGWIDQ